MRSLSQCWSNWAGACDPVLSQELFTPAVQKFTQIFRNWIEEEPQKPLVVAADSRDEALAFLYCLTESTQLDAEEPHSSSSAVVFDSTEALNLFNTHATLTQIAVVHTPDVEINLGGLFRKCHCIIVQPSNGVVSIRSQPDIRIGIVGKQDLESVLLGMGITKRRIRRLVNESAGSPTILRRCLSTIPEVQTPTWAEYSEIARILLPMTLVGAWNDDNSVDREIVRCLANASKYEEVDKHISELLALEDTPLWSEGDYRGVISRTDSIYGIARFINKTDLENFMFVAEIVLSERDPAIDLPKDDRWAAPIYNKVRDHSDAIRCGICESLILLSEFGETLFDQRLGVNTQFQVETLICSLLTPLDYGRLVSQKANLPSYAEAAPHAFLSLIESSLKCEKTVIREFLSPSKTAPFTSPNRTYLLWALECLAWDPLLFPRVVEILVKLCEIILKDESDNYLNAPVSTLFSLFRSWLPMSAVSLNERLLAFEKLCNNHPSLGWGLCMSHLYWRVSYSIDNYRPRWRYYMKTEDRKIFNSDEHFVFISKVIEIIINWSYHDEHMLNDLIERLHFLTEDEQLRIWNLIDQWADSNPSEEAKAYLHQRVHQLNFSGGLRKGRMFHKDRIQPVYEKLLPTNQVIRCAWLFESYLIQVHPDFKVNQEIDYDENKLQLDKLRTEKIKEIWEISKFKGIAALLGREKTMPVLIGGSIAQVLTEFQEALGFVEECILATTSINASRYKSCLIGFLRSVESNFITQMVDRYEYESKSLLTLLLCLPFRKSTWQLLDDKDQMFRNAYWENVNPHITNSIVKKEEFNRSIDELLAVDRTIDAFYSVNFRWNEVETSRLIKLLNSIVSLTPEETLDNDVHSCDVSKAFDELNKRLDATIEEKIALEFAFLRIFVFSGHDISNLEKQITDSPEFFVNAIRIMYRRSDGADDYSILENIDSEQLKGVMENYSLLLRTVRRIPGTTLEGNIDSSSLNEWLRRVRDLLQQYDRIKHGDRCIGRILANAPTDDDGVWPCRPVCEALEQIASDDIGKGFVIGVRNLRGVYRREEGGNQEREIAERYRKLSCDLISEYPYVVNLLKRIANSYEYQAKWEDHESKLRMRLEY